MGKLYSGRKVRLLIHSDGGCWHGEVVGWLTRSGNPSGWLEVQMWLSLLGGKMEVGTEIRKAGSN